jgi:catechol 2,3-dioxygenase-like lactoylglutathione lyase family enzyme
MEDGSRASAVRVSKLGYVEFETPDVDRKVDYHTNVLDFTLVERTTRGAFITTGFDHHCVVLTEGKAWTTLSPRR